MGSESLFFHLCFYCPPRPLSSSLGLWSQHSSKSPHPGVLPQGTIEKISKPVVLHLGCTLKDMGSFKTPGSDPSFRATKAELLGNGVWAWRPLKCPAWLYYIGPKWQRNAWLQQSSVLAANRIALGLKRNPRLIDSDSPWRWREPGLFDYIYMYIPWESLD